MTELESGSQKTLLRVAKSTGNAIPVVWEFFFRWSVREGWGFVERRGAVWIGLGEGDEWVADGGSDWDKDWWEGFEEEREKENIIDLHWEILIKSY
jgi:hypothetical protein